jgi:hypothetical protein
MPRYDWRQGLLDGRSAYLPTADIYDADTGAELGGEYSWVDTDRGLARRILFRPTWRRDKKGFARAPLTGRTVRGRFRVAFHRGQQPVTF